MNKALPFLMLCATTALAQSSPELEKASRFVFDQKFAEAAKALEVAARVQGNGRETVLRIYEMQGVVYGQLGQASKAREAFQALLSLVPKHELSGRNSPKVLAAFSSAKEWANTNPPLEFKAAKAALDDKGRVMQLAAKVKSDAMKLVRKVRFHLRADDGKWIEKDSELQGVYAAADVDSGGVEWWAELLGENDRVLMVAGTENAPVREGKVKDLPAAVAVADAPVAEPVVEPKVDPDQPIEEKKPEPKRVSVVAETAAPGSSKLRPIGYVLMGAGVVGLGVGAVFGYQSLTGRSRITNAAKDSQDRVTGITQKEAFALEPQVKAQAVQANVLFFVGGSVALVGGILWLVGSSADAASVAISPTVGGVVANGTF